MARVTDEPGEDSRAGGVRRGLVLAGQLLLTAAVTWFIVDRVGLSLAELGDVDPARWKPRWGLLLLASAVLLGGYALSGLVWGVMVRDLGGPSVPAFEAVRVYLVANLGRYIPGKLWQIAGMALLARRAGVSARVATVAAVLGQAIALSAAALVGATALLGAGPAYRTTALWTLGLLAAGTAVALTPPVLRRLVALWTRLAGLDPEGAGEAPVARAGPGMVARWGALYLVNWIVYAVSFWIFVKSFDLPGTVLQIAPAFAAAYVIGYAMIFAPAGLGVREGALTAFLGPVTGVATAATLAVAARVWTTLVEVGPAGALWVRTVAEPTGEGARGAGEGRS